MNRMLILILAGLLMISATVPATAQLARNPKISPPDLETAQAETRQSGGANAELIYAARLDVIQKGNFDSLIVIYAKAVKSGKDYFAVVQREGKKYPLAFDKQGQALKSGDKYLHMGLKHEEGKSPILRLIGATTNPKQGEQQRNVDFRFNGTEFLVESQSLTQVAR
ncbi:MAG: hypothetical protein ACREAM_08275 [Blastocatellia bacterium]